ncbi:MAG: 50S ribosomal protein L29 [Planctomycetes bacterium]|jgi:ribosomal protein L29|nr:50S ribosomal protein L29 [Planctomycetota bacterium]
MKKSAKTDLRAKGADELAKEVGVLRDQLLKARFSQRLEGKAKGMRYRASRRQIARLETIIREKAAPAAEKA